MIILVGMSYGIFVRGSSVAGIDFAGGDAVTLTYQEKIDVEKLRAVLAQVGDTQIQYQKGDRQEMLEVVAPFGKGAEVTSVLTSAFPSAGFHQIGHDTVGASVGKEIQKSNQFPFGISHQKLCQLPIAS